MPHWDEDCITGTCFRWLRLEVYISLTLGLSQPHLHKAQLGAINNKNTYQPKLRGNRRTIIFENLHKVAINSLIATTKQDQIFHF